MCVLLQQIQSHPWIWTNQLNQLEPRSSLTQVLPAALCLVVLRVAWQMGVGFGWVWHDTNLREKGRYSMIVYRFPIFPSLAHVMCSIKINHESSLVRFLGLTLKSLNRFPVLFRIPQAFSKALSIAAGSAGWNSDEHFAGDSFNTSIVSIFFWCLLQVVPFHLQERSPFTWWNHSQHFSDTLRLRVDWASLEITPSTWFCNPSFHPM